MHNPRVLLSTTTVATVVTALLALPCSAQEQCGDSVCDLGWTCATHEQTCPGCAEGADCGECHPGTFQHCVPAPCDSDADCGGVTVCADVSSMECPESFSSACLSGESDQQCVDRVKAAEQAQCTQVNTRECQPRWTQNCDSVDDCGEGFECLDSGTCRILDDSCQSDADCPETWQCHAVISGSCGVDQGMTEEECDQALEAMRSSASEGRCVSPTHIGVGGSTSSAAVNVDEQVLADAEDGVAAPDAASGQSTRPQASDDGETESISATPSDDGNTESASAAPSIEGETESISAAPSDDAGCSVGGAPRPGRQGMLALVVGLLLAARWIRPPR